MEFFSIVIRSKCDDIVLLWCVQQRSRRYLLHLTNENCRGYISPFLFICLLLVYSLSIILFAFFVWEAMWEAMNKFAYAQISINAIHISCSETYFPQKKKVFILLLENLYKISIHTKSRLNKLCFRLSLTPHRRLINLQRNAFIQILNSVHVFFLSSECTRLNDIKCYVFLKQIMLRYIRSLAVIIRFSRSL